MNSQERIAAVSDHLSTIRRAASELVNTLIMKYPELDDDSVNAFFTSNLEFGWTVEIRRTKQSGKP
jgi:hypothetical protein